jgi:alpha/beta superfamily hydrolase
MDNRVVYRAAKAAAEAGFAALRFNFRGVGQSTGAFDQGIGEEEDVAAAIDWLEARYQGLPIALAGYSFGAWVGLRVGCADPRIRALVGLGLPLDLYDFDFLTRTLKPALYIIGTRDEYCSQENLERLEPRLPGSSTVYRVEGSSHFFDGYIEVIQNLVGDFFVRLELDRGAE